MNEPKDDPPELTCEQSAAVMRTAADVRPDDQPGAHRLASADKVGAREVSDAESAAIVATAVDMRPGEDVHPDETQDEG